MLLLAWTPVAYAQLTVTGTVTDAASEEPLPGVNISVLGTTTGTTTDIEGQYSITVPSDDATLVFSFVGYQPQEIPVQGRSQIDVQMGEDVELLEDIVVVGYGTQRRGDVTGSVASVDVEEAVSGQVTSPQEMLQGRIAGVNVAPNSGEPGGGASISIRGTSSISAGSEPLYVIDGVPINSTTITPGGATAGEVTSSNTTNPLAMLNPQDIESIQVLKDAAATAIYGSEGANGVVLIQTKGGIAGTFQIDYTGKVSASTPARKLDLLTGDAYRAAVDNLLDQEASPGPSTDWQDATMQTAFTQSHALSFSGGTDRSSYRASLSFLDQEGLIENSGIERYTGRLNAAHQELDGRLRLNVNLTGSIYEQNHAFFSQGGGFEGGVIKGMIAFDPRLAVRDDDGFVEYSRNIRNPVGLLSQITDITDQKRLLGNFTAEVDIIESLTAKGTIGIDLQDGIRRTYLPATSSVGGEINGLARQAERELSNFVVQTITTYNNEIFEGQRLQVLGGFEFKREVFQDVGTETRDFISDAFLFNNLGGGSNVQNPFSSKSLVDQISFFGRANYQYKDRYLLEATLRRDGSSVFGENERFAWFPSASVGWRISNEPFMENVNWLSQLKLRLSAGLSGNQAVPPYQTLAALAPQAGYRAVFGEDAIVTGLAQERAANPDLKWEETTEYNIGLDFTAGRFDGTLDIYRKSTEDLLLDVRVPPPSPAEFALQNVGAVENTGVEFALSAYVVEREDWWLTLSGTISSNRNEITDLGGRGFIDHSAVGGAGQSGVLAQRLEEGHPIGAFYGPVFLGLDEAGNELYKAPDGGTTTDATQAVREFIGNPIPDFSYSFNINLGYKRFDVSAFFRGEQGREVFNNTALEFQTLGNLGQGINLLEDALTDGTNVNHIPVYSSRWIQDGSFLRLDNLTVGYNLPASTAFGFRRARVYVSGQNLFVITPYEGYDPELNTNIDAGDTGFRSLSRPDRGIDYTSYPKSRTFTLGVELGL